MAPIFARCKICKDHIISYVDEWKERKEKNGSITRYKEDVWLHDIYDFEPDPDHAAVPDTGII
jgi:hypothetical protein